LLIDRLQRITRKVETMGLDALLVVKDEVVARENARYVTGFTGSSAYVIISPAARVLLTDDRYTEQAAEECPEFEIVRHERPFTKKLGEVLMDLSVKRLGFERGGLTVEMLDTFREDLPGVEFVPTLELIEEFRAVKDEGEIALIAKAAAIADKGFSHILEFIRPGMTEKEAALALEFFMRRSGADGLAFDMIFVSGKRSSHQHGAPTDKKIQSGDLITIDFGALYEGYRSDITRTVVVGRADQKQREVYEMVKRGQQKALDILRAGVVGREALAEVKKVAEDAGYDASSFGIGHGVGLAIHEVPFIRAYGDLILQTGHVVTAEPGIYIPDWGGVRIEDTVVIEESCCRVLTKSSKELIEL